MVGGRILDSTLAKQRVHKVAVVMCRGLPNIYWNTLGVFNSSLSSCQEVLERKDEQGLSDSWVWVLSPEERSNYYTNRRSLTTNNGTGNSLGHQRIVDSEIPSTLPISLLMYLVRKDFCVCKLFSEKEWDKDCGIDYDLYHGNL